MSVDISVIVTSYNKQQYLSRAIRSCLKQSIDPKKIEIIVVDDASTDNSKLVIEGMGPKVVPVFLTQNVGVAEASNIGIRSALGTYILRLDADDYLAEHALLFLSEILDKNHDVGFVYGDIIKVDINENILARVNLDTPEKIFRHGAGIMFRKSYLEKLGLYDKDFKNAEDHELLSRYIKNFNGYHLRLPLYRYSQHETQMTKDEDERKLWEKKISN
jgi:glycosyltransferase involved in cell wall biosynthesis